MASSSQHLETASLPVSNVLFQIAASVMSKAPEIFATVSPLTTWTSALQIVQRSLEPVDQQLVIFPKTTRERQQALQEIALSTLRTSTNTPSTFDGLPIKTNVLKHQIPPRSSPAMRTRLQELAKENMKFGDQQPYHLQLGRGITEQVLPVIAGTLRLRGLDKVSNDETDDYCFDVKSMLWDTGAHCCTITDDILPAKFRTYLQSSEHDPYRDAGGVRVQVDGYIALTNLSFIFNTLFQVRPASSMPNARSGIILGQTGFLNRISWTSVPRFILETRGEDVGETSGVRFTYPSMLTLSATTIRSEGFPTTMVLNYYTLDNAL